ncbi:glutaredoxin [Corynebacterium minutissimum]|uniref:glutaredoxin n=1 Tax=Corynebacterium minutissimum TaxID=38301 RepID=UPI001EF2D852|nr:glutaredoxin [Corynebacterium minutissimum]MCG7239590.1 glutaredoxin [Corynebacterium minutissimum]
MTNYHAFVYSRPGCMKCRATAHALTSMGVDVTIRQLDEHPFKRELMENHGWQELPLVELHGPDGDVMRWAGMSSRDLAAAKYLTRESA